MGEGERRGGRMGERGWGKRKGVKGEQQDLPVRAEARGGGGVPMNSRAA